MKIVYNTENDNRTKLGMEKLPIGVVRRKLNPDGLGHKSYRSRNKKKCFKCFKCDSYDNVIVEQVIMFGHKTLSYVCIDCKKKELRR